MRPPFLLTTPRNYETPQRKQSEISQAIPEKFRPHQGGQPGSKTYPRRRKTMTRYTDELARHGITPLTNWQHIKFQIRLRWNALSYKIERLLDKLN